MYFIYDVFDLKEGYRIKACFTHCTHKAMLLLRFFHQSKAFVNIAPLCKLLCAKIVVCFTNW